jgi:tetratricopeptide (TPR) repeat protein
MNKIFFCLIFLFFNGALFSQEEEEHILSKEDSARLPLIYARVSIDTGNVDLAFKSAKAFSVLNPTSFEAFNVMALCKIELNDISEAKNLLQKSMKLQIDNLEALTFYAYAYAKKGDHQGAVTMIKKALAFDDQNIQTIYYAGIVYQLGSDKKIASDYFSKVIDKNERHALALMNRGYIKFESSLFKYAIQDLNTADSFLLRNQKTVQLYTYLARAKAALNDNRGCIESYNRVLELDAKNEMAYTYRGAAKLSLNDVNGAIDDLTKAIEINGKSHVAYNYRGTAKGGQGVYDEALKDLDKSIKLKFDYASAYFNRAAVLFSKKDKINACEDLKKAESLGHELAFKYVERYCKN